MPSDHNVVRVNNYHWKQVRSPYGRPYIKQTYMVTWEDKTAKPSRVNALDITANLINEYWSRVDEHLREKAANEAMVSTEQGLSYERADKRIKALKAKNLPDVSLPPYHGYDGLDYAITKRAMDAIFGRRASEESERLETSVEPQGTEQEDKPETSDSA